MTLSKKILMLASCAALSLAACSPGHEAGRKTGQLPPPPQAAKPAALPIAGAHGLQDSVYFNDELSQARAKVEAMRGEMALLSAKLSSLQNKIQGLAADSGPALLPTVPGETVTTTTTQVVPATATLADVAKTMNTAPAVKEAATTTSVKTPVAAPMPITGEMAKPAPEAKAEKKDVKPDAKAAPKAEAKTGAGVKGVRFGTHGNTVRIVLDVNGAAAGAKPALDNAEHILTVTLPKTKWTGTKTQAVAKSPLVASYSAQDAGEGSVVAFVLKGDTKIISSSVLQNPTRVVVDLAK